MDRTIGAEARGRPAPAQQDGDSAVAQHGGDTPGAQRMLAPTQGALATVHRKQIERAPWPDFDRFEVHRYDPQLRRAAAVQWAGRARAEHGSVHQFSAVSHALCEARVPVALLGALSRLITDEVRHAELCAKMALCCYPEGLQDEPQIFAWPRPRAPWRDAPSPSDDPEPLTAWAVEAIAVACCVGETLSRPMLDAIATVSTDPTVSAVAQQILRDEHLHAAFGWDALRELLPGLGAPARASLHDCIARALAGVEATTCCGVSLSEVVGRELVIERADEPNLGTLTDVQYATIFYATIEAEVLPRFVDLGLAADRAWADRARIAASEDPVATA